MDSERYARLRELFLAVEELPADEQVAYLQSQVGDDQELIDEVLSLLEEHDEESARIEGNAAKPPPLPSTGEASDSESASRRPGQATTDDENASASVAPFLPSADQPLKSAGGQRQVVGDARPAHSHSTRSNLPGSGALTQRGPNRTHAGKRYRKDSINAPNAAAGLWKYRVRRQRRFNSGWLWLAAILPTALMGWWTYHKVTNVLRNAAANEVIGIADSVSVSIDRFLDDQARLVQSWSRQPDVRDAILELIEIADEKEPVEKLKQAPQTEQIKEQLVALSQREDIKFVVWDRTGMIVASWLDDRADVGGTVAPDGAAKLALAMRGETVLFGPEILKPDDSGFIPETDRPVMAIIVPVYSQDDRIVASMLIRGFGMFDEFDEIFRQASVPGRLDVYAVNGDGTMVTNSPSALLWIGASGTPDEVEFIADRMRVTDPGKETPRSSLPNESRTVQPLTYAVARVTSSDDGLRMDGYRNYAGTPVVGAWRWLADWELGVIVERTYSNTFETAGIVLLGFVILGMLLTITALIAAARIARRTVMSQAAVHPLSRYELIKELGSGGMGVVYKARHTQLGRDTALKVLRGDRGNEEDQLRFDREAKLAASLSSPHTVTIYDYGRNDDGEAYCVMEFLRGITLDDVVARSGYQEYGRALYVLRQICDSLGEAHHLGLVHRDIKPQNVMLSLDASVGDWAVVFDFGLAKPLQTDIDAYQTTETIWAGTPMYMAPERYREPNKIDPRSDIYSVGCVAYFLLAGRPPYLESDPESLFALVLTEDPISIGVHRDETVPRQIDALVRRCMAKRAEDRYQTIDDLAKDLDRLIALFPWTVDDARGWWRVHGEEIN
ncbi:serine/threonine protein kinase [Roseiconus nitratireducens]|uniref:Serine/threonine protein kinase n=1 Tax=Roseiconus nitratireducens TaxID=2605748 RepID=A0A5M6DEH4_9BACT|nr:serine/threonine protein kinase [Roseiconus nitratireducens]KAA5545934.1 serine/threonine protein kinase [Roseiconus nitratireducens]